MTVKRTSIPAHPTNFYVGRQGKHVQFVVIHDGETDEGTTAAEGMAKWFAQDHGPGRRSSAHRSADTDSIASSVALKDTAFGAPGVNNTGIHIEHAGRAGQSASQWDDAASRLILANGAQAAAEASVEATPLTADRKPIPAVWLTDAQLRAAQTNPRIKGFITHRQASRVLGGTHTDPGPNFPSDRYMTLVRSHLGGAPTLAEEFLMALPETTQKAIAEDTAFTRDRLAAAVPDTRMVIDPKTGAASRGGPNDPVAPLATVLDLNSAVRQIVAAVKVDARALGTAVAAALPPDQTITDEQLAAAFVDALTQLASKEA